jgi:hypothetical protein
MEVTQKIKIELQNDTVILLGYKPPRYIPKGSEISILKRYLYSQVNCNIIHDSHHMEYT